MAYRTPNDGGCWYCNNDLGTMYFSTEFDAYLHLECLKARIAENRSDDRETTIIAEEFIDIPEIAEAMGKAQSPSRSANNGTIADRIVPEWSVNR